MRTFLVIVGLPTAFLFSRYFAHAAGARSDARHHRRVMIQMRKAQLKYTIRTAAVAVIALILLIGYVKGH